ncbi:fungal-specific transcription factor domain-containing protein, partial [Thelonectria olida]
RALMALRNRVAELEGRLAGVSTSSGQPIEPSVIDDQGRSPLVKNTPAGIVSEAESQETNPESAADILATNVFDRQPGADIGYFGPSSNHALFRFLTTVITNMRVRGNALFQDGTTCSPVAEKPASALPERPSAADQAAMRRNEQGFPDPQTCIEWIARFFDTVGVVLPYVSEAPLLREVNKMGTALGYDTPQSRPTKALLNVVFAHALSTLDQGSPEPFYHKALGLLLVNEQTVGSWNLETIQALLLLGSYQQNTQRAMTSLSSHSLAVKVSYQLGLHSPSSYEHLGAQEKELRVKIWFAVVNQDRILSVSLGRPCLIPPQYVRIEIPESIAPRFPAGTVKTSASLKSSIYFSQIISLHETIGVALDSIYGSNLELHTQLPPRELTMKALEHLDLLEHQRYQNAHFATLNPNSDLESWSPDKFQSEAHVLLLSLYYDRTVMIVSAPTLMTVLEQATNDGSGDIPSGIIRDTAVSVLKRDWEAIKEFRRILSAILRFARPFLRSNAVWWVCNFTDLFHECNTDVIVVPALDPNETQALPESANGSALQEDFLDFMFGSVDDVFRQLGDNEYLGSDVLSMEQSINNYDAGGLLDRWNQ